MSIITGRGPVYEPVVGVACPPRQRQLVPCVISVHPEVLIDLPDKQVLAINENVYLLVFVMLAFILLFIILLPKSA